MLQKMLNLAKETQVAQSGVGSPGQESNYFGTRTKLAVIRFQELYRKEILTPVGLLRGTGYFGQGSSAKLALLCRVAAQNGGFGGVLSGVNTPSPAPVPPVSITPPPPSPAVTIPFPSGSSVPATTPLSVTATQTDKVRIMYPSEYAAPRNAAITLFGVGFSQISNDIHFDDYVMTGLKADKWGMIKFVVPFDITRGKHALWVTTATGGVSNKSFFVVTDPAVPGPVVASYTPKEGWVGTTVTITGSGFTPTGNNIHVGYGVIQGVPSLDGQTLQFTMSPQISGVAPGQDVEGYNFRSPFWFYIVNDNGLSGASEFIIKA
jgi:hypothetical protein